MKYELHITVEGESDKALVARFQDYCIASQLCKSNLIALSSGIYTPQLMLAKKTTFDSDDAAIEWGMRISEAIASEGFKPTRIKVESPLTEGLSAYYESHFKFRSGTPVTFGGFLKSNNVLHDGIHYLSLRHYVVGDVAGAFAKFESGKVTTSKVPSFEGCHYERVIIDTNPQIDSGWVPEA